MTGDDRRKLAIAELLKHMPHVYEQLFIPGKPEMVALPEEMMKRFSYLSGAEKVMLAIALEMWNHYGGVELKGITELRRLDERNFIAFLKALQIWYTI